MQAQQAALSNQLSTQNTILALLGFVVTTLLTVFGIWGWQNIKAHLLKKAEDVIEKMIRERFLPNLTSNLIDDGGDNPSMPRGTRIPFEKVTLKKKGG
jgi:hypothetical protein